MMFCFVPAIPLLWFAVGAIIGGGTVVVIDTAGSKPPYEKPKEAYENYVKAIEECDYKRYQWSVSDPIPEAPFTMKCDQRKKRNLAKITEGIGDVSLENGKTEGRTMALSPWTREQTNIYFKKIGNSWKVVDKPSQSD